MLLCLILFVILFSLQINWLYKVSEFQTEKSNAELSSVMKDIGKVVVSDNYHLYHHEVRKLNILELNRIKFAIDSILEHKNIHTNFTFALRSEAPDCYFQRGQENENHLVEDYLQSPYQICLSCFSEITFVDDEDAAKMMETNSSDHVVSKYSYYTTIEGLTRRFTPDDEIIWLSVIPKGFNKGRLSPLLTLFLLSALLIGLLLFLFNKIYRDFVKYKRVSEIKEDFINNITHEFKTPLSSIRLASRVLRKSTDQNKKDNYHDLIENESDNLEKQIDGLLELSLINNEEIKLEKDWINIHEIIQSVIAESELKIIENNSNIYFDLKIEDPKIKGDSYHIKNSISNLIENALKYGGQNVDIFISSYTLDSKMIFKIRDTGTGIAPEDRKYVFERFYRGQKRNVYKGKGFGIGLSYVYSIIHAHNGSVKLNPEINSGTEFIITFLNSKH